MPRELSTSRNAVNCRARYQRVKADPVRYARHLETQRRAGERCRAKTGVGYSRNAHLRRTYGITLAERDEMLAQQGGRCAMCRGERHGARWHVDHDHKTGKVRSILCHRCNVNLGAYERLSEYVGLSAVESYLSGWPVGDDMSAMRSG